MTHHESCTDQIIDLDAVRTAREAAMARHPSRNNETYKALVARSQEKLQDAVVLDLLSDCTDPSGTDRDDGPENY